MTPPCPSPDWTASFDFRYSNATREAGGCLSPQFVDGCFAAQAGGAFLAMGFASGRVLAWTRSPPQRRARSVLILLLLILADAVCFFVFAVFRLAVREPRQWVGLDLGATVLWCTAYQLFTLQMNLQYLELTTKAHAMFQRLQQGTSSTAASTAAAERSFRLLSALHVCSVVVMSIANWFPLAMLGNEQGFRIHLYIYLSFGPIASLIPLAGGRKIVAQIDTALAALDTMATPSPRPTTMEGGGSISSSTSSKEHATKRARILALRKQIILDGVGYDNALLTQFSLIIIFLASDTLWPFIGPTWVVLTVTMPIPLIVNANALLPWTPRAQFATSSKIQQGGGSVYGGGGTKAARVGTAAGVGVLSSIFEAGDNHNNSVPPPAVLVFDDATKDFVMVPPHLLSAALDELVVTVVTATSSSRRGGAGGGVGGGRDGGSFAASPGGGTMFKTGSKAAAGSVQDVASVSMGGGEGEDNGTANLLLDQDVDVLTCNAYLVAESDTALGLYAPRLNTYFVRQLQSLDLANPRRRKAVHLFLVVTTSFGMALLALLMTGVVPPLVALVNFVSFLGCLPLMFATLSVPIMKRLMHTPFFRFRMLAIVIEGVSFAVVLADTRILMVPLFSFFQCLVFCTDAVVGTFRPFRVSIALSSLTSTSIVFLLSQLDLVDHAHEDIIPLQDAVTYSNAQFSRDAHLASMIFLGFEVFFLLRRSKQDERRFAHITTAIVKDVVNDNELDLPVRHEMKPGRAEEAGPIVAAQASTVDVDQAGSLVRFSGMRRVFVNHLHIRQSSCVAVRLAEYMDWSRARAFALVQALESPWADGMYWGGVAVSGALLGVLTWDNTAAYRTEPEAASVELGLSLTLVILGLSIWARAALLHSRTVLVLLLRRSYFYFNTGFMLLWTTLSLVVLGGGSIGLVVLPIFVFMLFLEDALDDASVFPRRLGFVACRQAVFAMLLCSLSVLLTLGRIRSLGPPSSSSGGGGGPWRPLIDWRPDTRAQRINSTHDIYDDPSVTDISNQVSDIGLGIAVTYLLIPVQVLIAGVSRGTWFKDMVPHRTMTHFRSVTAPVEPTFALDSSSVSEEAAGAARHRPPPLGAAREVMGGSSMLTGASNPLFSAALLQGPGVRRVSRKVVGVGGGWEEEDVGGALAPPPNW